MPAVRTRPRDVLIKVPKIEPYSNSYTAPTARAKNAAAAAFGATNTDASAPDITTTNTVAVDPTASGEGADKRTERENSPILPFLSVSRPETQTIDMSKAATSSAGWNSLLVWARRQRGAQWDSSTAIWHVDKDSPEYYSFCEDPAQLNPLIERQTKTQADSGSQPTNGTNPSDTMAEEDRGPSRFSSRMKEGPSATPSRNNSPPPIALGRSARLLRR